MVSRQVQRHTHRHAGARKNNGFCLRWSMTTTPASILLGFAHLIQFWKVVPKGSSYLNCEGIGSWKGSSFSLPVVWRHGAQIFFSPCCLTFKIKIFLSPHLSLSNLCDCNLRHRLKRTSVNKSLLFGWIFFPRGAECFLTMFWSQMVDFTESFQLSNRNEDRQKRDDPKRN